MERSENSARKFQEAGPLPSCTEAARAGSRSEQARNDDTAKWVAALRRFFASIPANPSSPNVSGTSAESGDVSLQPLTSLAYNHVTTATAPFSSIVSASNKMSSGVGFTSLLLPILHNNLTDMRHESKSKTKMIQISRLPFEI
ncbi:hypothetical protein CGCVW01_v005825 [Colletotrichum viniferum]|nr:hypothetical protein CGCVW01_v005825 [Colletotrichum viniferum]